MKRAIGDNYAERNGPFIFWCVSQTLGNGQDYDVAHLHQAYQTPNDHSGLYIFFIESNSKQYPIYIGITSRSFRKRFTEHRSDSEGVINQFVNGRFPQNVPHHRRIGLFLKVKCIALDYPMIAKLLESVFLAAFDFCLNKEENGNVRRNIDLHQQFLVEHSKPSFNSMLANIMDEIARFYNRYQSNYW